MAAAVDDLSGGRLVLGIGAGWQDREHHNFGIPFPPTRIRYEMLDEYLQVVTLLLRSDEPVSFEGRHYQLHDAILLPRPARAGGPPILIGGNGERRTLPLVARYAGQWNAVFISADGLRPLMARLDTLLDEQGRPRNAVKRTIMLGTFFARDDRELRDKLSERGRSLEGVLGKGSIVGTPEMWIGQLKGYVDAGIQRFMLQWLAQDALEPLEIISREVLPAMTRETVSPE
jgi:alkanesulfonate monooxygenase SsuD/methylene tetrahydromethanopterin reductase-like flavin-dependent oxidoreductase (luciferase family)